MNRFQAYIFDVVQAIYLHYPDSLKIYGSKSLHGKLLQENEVFIQHDLANTLETLAKEGEAFFYRGEIAHIICQICQNNGGHLSKRDFEQYQVVKREPLAISYRDANVLTNPAPSSGGTLIAFALQMMNSIDLSLYKPGTGIYLDLLAQIQTLTNKARIDSFINSDSHHPKEHILDSGNVEIYRKQIIPSPMCSRGTTHISVIDQQGNIASLTTSNGEGCGVFVPGTGIMLNNMLGEEDLNPNGFHQWPTNQRMTSMMAPSIVSLPDQSLLAIGSGGSNRLRTAILQVLINIIDFKMPVSEAVQFPRIHHENGLLNIEAGFDPEELNVLVKNHPNHKIWDSRNLFFGGTHSVCRSDKEFFGIGDPRRGGYALVV